MAKSHTIWNKGKVGVYSPETRRRMGGNKFPMVYDCPALTEPEWAYIAGFIDGEGSILKVISHRANGKPIYHYRIILAHTHLPTIQWLQAKLGVGNIYLRKQSQHSVVRSTKPQYGFQVSRRLATLCILKKLLPYLIEKKDRAQRLVDELEAYSHE